MGGLVESLMDELSYNVVFTIPLSEGIDVLELAVVTWIIIAVMMAGSLLLVHGLRVRQVNNKQAALESGLSLIYGFSEGPLGKDGRDYIPYLITVMLYTGIANMIGLFGSKSPIKSLNVAVPLAVMSIVLAEAAGIRKGRVKGWVESFTEPIAIIAPINVLELFIKPFSLCIQLFGNVLGVIVVITLIEYLPPLIVPLPFSFYFDIFDGVIQTYVFAFLASLYIKETIEG